MRKLFLALAVATTVLVLSSGIALAAAFSGTQGDDNLTGTARADEIYGLRGNDDISGRDGEDELYGGSGGDDVFGGSNADELYGGTGSDELRGGPGNDFINSADNSRQDIVDCGGGDNDRAVADNEDTVVGCENEEPV